MITENRSRSMFAWVLCVGFLAALTPPASAEDIILVPVGDAAAGFADLEVFEEPAAVPFPGTAPEPAPGRPVETKPAPAEADEPEAPEPPRPAVPVNPRVVRLHLMDGSVISGELSVEEILVDTEFGRLTVPVISIQSITPGLDSHPELAGRVEDLIEKLGSDDYKTREQAHKDLAGMGTQVRPILERQADDGNAERKRHIADILKQFAELEDQEAGFDEEEERHDDAWQPHDTVVTTKFTIAGKVSPATFTVRSKYGPLTVRLADVRTATRDIGGGSESIRRSLSVPGDNLAQRSFKNSGIKLERGDKITITADGQIVMSPWGSNAFSGPDGAPNYGTYMPNIFTGALVAKVGNSGPVFKVGGRHRFTADRPGILQFAVAMNPSYAQGGYSFPGQYNVKVRVDRENGGGGTPGARPGRAPTVPPATPGLPGAPLPFAPAR